MSDHDPYELHIPVPIFTVTSEDIVDGQPLPDAQRAPASVSPQLSWSGFSPQTKSFAITCFDPDAPTGSGFWHWALYNIPASVTSIPSGAGGPAGAVPPRATVVKNELRRREYFGAQPPQGTGVHRYFFVVHAIDVEHLDVDSEATPAILSFNLNFHALGRGFIVPTAEYQGS
jgi:Raf kinase inhibitor-like YbhB/YbcL family protein